MTDLEMQTRAGYDRALADIARGRIGGPEGRLGVLMPAALHLVRQDLPASSAGPFPAWFDLSDDEIGAAMRLWQVIEADGLGALPFATGNPALVGFILPIHDLRDQMRAKGWPLLRLSMLDVALPDDPNADPFHPVLAAARLVQYTLGIGARLRRGTPAGSPRSVSGSADDLIAWLAQAPDPDLWHLIATDINPDNPVALPLLRWIVAQPDCDRATAATVFCLLDGMRHVGRPLPPADRDGAADLDIIATLCLRSEGPGFPRHRLALPPFRHGRRGPDALLAAMAGQDTGPGPGRSPFPGALLRGPFGRQAPRTAWDILDGDTFVEKA